MSESEGEDQEEEETSSIVETSKESSKKKKKRKNKKKKKLEGDTPIDTQVAKVPAQKKDPPKKSTDKDLDFLDKIISQ